MPKRITAVVNITIERWTYQDLYLQIYAFTSGNMVPATCAIHPHCLYQLLSWCQILQIEVTFQDRKKKNEEEFRKKGTEDRCHSLAHYCTVVHPHPHFLPHI